MMRKMVMKLTKLMRNLLIQVRVGDPPTWHAKDVMRTTIYGAIQPLCSSTREIDEHKEQN